MAETVDLADNRLPVILCSEQFGIVAKDPDCNSGPGIEPTSDVWAVRRKYLLPPATGVTYLTSSSRHSVDALGILSAAVYRHLEERSCRQRLRRGTK